MPAPGVDRKLLEQYLIGTVFGVLLFQRHLLVVHASGVGLADGEGAVLFLGESGAGKSTLSLAMQMEKGYTGLSDDAVGIDCSSQRPTMGPAYPFMKLSRKLADVYDIPLASLDRVPAAPEEYFFRFREPKVPAVLPVRAIFVLRTGHRPAVEEIAPVARVIELIRHSIPSRLLHRPGDAEHFNQCVTVARTVPLYSLARTTEMRTLPEVVNLVDRTVQQVAMASLP